MPSLVTQLEEVLRRGTDNEVWDQRLLELYDRLQTLMANCPEWAVLTHDRQLYLFLLAVIGVEEVDNDYLC